MKELEERFFQPLRDSKDEGICVPKPLPWYDCIFLLQTYENLTQMHKTLEYWRVVHLVLNFYSSTLNEKTNNSNLGNGIIRLVLLSFAVWFLFRYPGAYQTSMSRNAIRSQPILSSFHNFLVTLRTLYIQRVSCHKSFFSALRLSWAMLLVKKRSAWFPHSCYNLKQVYFDDLWNPI